MCGIAGIFLFNGANAQRELVEKMTATLEHRGPDGAGIFLDGPVGLGHRRLSIIDLETGSQPMHGASEQTTIVFNGEIYNYPDLRKSLAEQGYFFKTHSDTEVILALYQICGAEGFARLAGMFAFALWDARLNRLFLVRDRSGMKPLYFSTNGASFAFASEIKAIRSAFPHDELDAGAVNYYFSRQYIGSETTIFKNIKKVKPGTCLEITQNGQVKETVYWKLKPFLSSISFEEAVHETDRLLDQAVRSHLVSDVPVGVFLSGGLDSSTILAYAVENSGKPLQTFTVGFGKQSEYNETAFARLLAKHYNTSHHEIHVTEEEALACLPHIITNLDEPLADYALLPTYVMSRFAAGHVKVVLSGEGADEVFGGYKRYHPYALLDSISANGFFRQRLPSPCVFSPNERKKLISPERFIADSNLAQEQQFRRDKRTFSSAGHVNSILYADLQNWLTDDLLMKVDKMGMLASLEARMPFLDHRLIEYVFSLKGSFKVTLRKKKRLLRTIASRKLPQEIFNRPKHGFTVPVEGWLRGTLKKTFEDTVLSDSSNSEWLNLNYVKQLFESHLSGKNHRLQLWAILIFCLWEKEHL